MSLRTKLTHWVYWFLVRFRFVKGSAYSAAELNALLHDNFPKTCSFQAPGSQGQLIIEGAELTIPPAQPKIHVALFCSMKIESMGTPIYRAHVLIDVAGAPHYRIADKTITAKDLEIVNMQLVADEYSLLANTQSLLTQLVPRPFKNLFSNTVSTTLNAVSGGTYTEVVNYLSLYIHGNKQKILDFHRTQVASIITDFAHSGDLQYQLNDDAIEERLFAEFGQEVRICEGSLHFIFADPSSRRV